MRNSIYLILLTLISFLFAIFTGGEIIYFIFYALFSLLLICFVFILIAKKSIKLKLDLKKHNIYVGEKLEYTICLKNNSIFPYLFIDLYDKSGQVSITTNLMPLKNKVIDRFFVSKRRGIYQIGFISIKIKDPFGIFQVTRSFDSRCKICVYPRVYNLNMSLPAKIETGSIDTNNRTYEDYTNLSNLREYVDGDSLKKVHWKISAKKQKLYVKEYEFTASNGLYILWDLDVNHYKKDIDGIIDEYGAECMISITKSCLIKYIPVSLIDYGTKKIEITGKGPKDFVIFNTFTLSTFPIFGYSFNNFIMGCLKIIPLNSTIAIITPSMNESIVKILLNIGLHRDIILFYINKNKIDNDTKTKLEKNNVKMIQWGDNNETTCKVQYI